IALIFALRGAETITIGIERAIQRHGLPGSEPRLQFPQQRTAGKAEIQIKTRNLLPLKILSTPFAQSSNGDWSIDIVEDFHRYRRLEHASDRLHRIGTVGPDHGHVRISQLPSNERLNLPPAFVNVNLA